MRASIAATSGSVRTVVRSAGGTNSAVHAIARDSRGSSWPTESWAWPRWEMIRLIWSAEPAVTSATDARVRNGTTTSGEGSRPAVWVAAARS